jgi:hypothetical protein
MLPELRASEVLLHPDLLEQISGGYLVLVHESSEQSSTKTMDDAITMVTAFGWRRIDLAVTRSQSVVMIFVLMEKVPNGLS